MTRRDLTGDGTSDIVLKRDYTGPFILWDLDEGRVTEVPLGAPPTGWTVAGSGDFDGDGAQDLLWLQIGEGFGARYDSLWFGPAASFDPAALHHMAAYLANIFFPVTRAVLLTLNFVPKVPVDGQDFDGDGRADVLMERTSSSTPPSISIGDLDASGRLTLSSLDPGAGAAVAGDVDGDGTTDLVWSPRAEGFNYQRHDLSRTPAKVTLWEMRDGVAVATVELGSADIAPGYALKVAADVDGNGTADLLWMNIFTRDIGVWAMDRTPDGPVPRWASYGPVPEHWVLAAVGDYDGNGVEDLLWRHPFTGEIGFWAMEHAHIAAWHSLGNPGTNWQVV